MKKLLVLPACTVLVLALALAAATRAGEPEWLTDFDEAAELAKAGDKLILLNFTGSDWCGYCQKMAGEVFDTREFKEYAAQHLILVEVDFPHSKRQTIQVKKQNRDLKKRYDAGGYPTFVVLDKDGRELGRHLGYMEGGPSAFIAKIDSLKK